MWKVSTWRGRYPVVAVVVIVLVVGIVSGPTLAATDTSSVTERAGSPADHTQDTPDETLVVEKGNPANYDTIQNAVDNATDGDTVEVRPGTYEEAVAIEKTITLTAPEGATIHAGDFLDQAIKISGDAAPVIDGFTLTGGGYGVYSVPDSSGDWTVRETTINGSFSLGVNVDSTHGDWTIQETTIDADNVGIDASGTSGNVTVRETTITNHDSKGVELSGSSGDWAVKNTTISDTSQGVVADDSTGNWLIQNTSITNTTWIGGAGVDAGGSSGDWLIRDTRISNTSGQGVSVVSADEYASGNWTVLNTTVTNTGDDGVDIKATGDWTIQDTTVTNIGRDGIDMRENSDETPWTITNTTVANTTEMGVRARGEGTIQDTTISNSSHNGLYLDWGDPVVRNITITDSGDDGVYYRSGTLRNVTITNSTSDGILVWSNLDMAAHNTTITDSGVDGIEAHDTEGNWTLREVTIANSGERGVDARRSEGDWTIRNSTINGSNVAGVDAGSDQFGDTIGAWTVRNTTIADSGGPGINAEDTNGNWTIRDTTVVNSSGAGVFARHTYQNSWRILNATVTDNGGPGVVARDLFGSEWAIHQSTISNNTQTEETAASGVDATDANVQGNATHNWWGDSSGPHHPEKNPEGEGDSVSGPVTFEPWLGMDEPEPALFTLTDPGLPDKVAVDEQFTASVLVENTGEKEDTQTLTLDIVNTTVSEGREVSLQPGENGTVSFENLSIADAGEYTVEIASDDELVSRTVNVSEDSGQPCIDVNDDGNCATDTTGDGLLNDVDGDGEFDIFDVQVLFSNLDAVQSNPGAFDFDGDDEDEVDIFDVQALFSALQEG